MVDYVIRCPLAYFITCLNSFARQTFMIRFEMWEGHIFHLVFSVYQ